MRHTPTWVHRVDFTRNRAQMVSVYPGQKICARIWALPLTARLSPTRFGALLRPRITP